MTKQTEAMKLALESLEHMLEDAKQECLTVEYWNECADAITALREALANEVSNEALNRMADNARELGLDYEQPVPVAKPHEQEPVAYGMWDTQLGRGGRMMMVRLDKGQDGCTVPLCVAHGITGEKK